LPLNWPAVPSATLAFRRTAVTTAVGKFEIKDWKEVAYQEFGDGRKLTRASVTQAFVGELEGAGSVEWLMYYRSDGSAEIVGLQLFSGTLGGRSGSFMLETRGRFEGAEAKGSWSVIERSGTDQLKGVRGQGTFVAPHGPTAQITLDYDFE